MDPFHRTEATCLHGSFFFFLWQRCVWWTAVPTARASAVCVTARKAGQDLNVSRGTVTHAASTTESAGRASVTATKAGRVNTALSVSHGDTCSTDYTPTHTWQKATNCRENLFVDRLKRATLECECQCFLCSFKNTMTHFWCYQPTPNKPLCLVQLKHIRWYLMFLKLKFCVPYSWSMDTDILVLMF